MFVFKISKRKLAKQRKQAESDDHLFEDGVRGYRGDIVSALKMVDGWELPPPRNAAFYRVFRHYPPSELLQLLGPRVLLIPSVAREIARLIEGMEFLQKQRDSLEESDLEIFRSAKRKYSYRGVELAFMRETHLTSTGDIKREIGLYRDELRAITEYFHRVADAKVKLARPRRPLRTLYRYEQYRAAGKTEKQAVAEIAAKENRSEAAVRSDIRHARARVGDRKIPFRRRGPRH